MINLEALGAEGRRFESCHPDQSHKGFQETGTLFFALGYNIGKTFWGLLESR